MMEECSVFIHDTYIADGDWRESLWNGIMTLLGRSGDTLVDIVSDLWTMTANAITKIKAGITEFVEGVKAGVAYFKENVLLPIVESFKSVILNVFEVIIATFITSAEIVYSSITDGFQITSGTKTINIELIIDSELNIVLLVNDQAIKIIKTAYLLPLVGFSDIETLTVSETGIGLAIGAMIAIDFITLFAITNVMLIEEGDPIYAIAIMAVIMQFFISMLSYAGAQDQSDVALMWYNFHLAASTSFTVLALILSGIFGLTKSISIHKLIGNGIEEFITDGMQKEISAWLGIDTNLSNYDYYKSFSGKIIGSYLIGYLLILVFLMTYSFPASLRSLVSIASILTILDWGHFLLAMLFGLLI